MTKLEEPAQREWGDADTSQFLAPISNISYFLFLITLNIVSKGP